MTHAVFQRPAPSRKTLSFNQGFLDHNFADFYSQGKLWHGLRGHPVSKFGGLPIPACLWQYVWCRENRWCIWYVHATDHACRSFRFRTGHLLDDLWPIGLIRDLLSQVMACCSVVAGEIMSSKAQRRELKAKTKAVAKFVALAHTEPP